MKRTTSLAIFMMCFFGIFCVINHNVFAQGNNNGNANSDNNANGNALKWETKGNNATIDDFIGTTNPIALKMRTNNIERLKITKDGNIGIGISNPLEKFELQGNLKLTGDIIFSEYADANDTLGKILFVDKDGRTKSVGLKFFRNMIGFPIGDCEVDAEGNVVKPTWQNGLNKIFHECPVNVGIGTKNPSHRLDVRGRIRSTSGIYLGGLATSTFEYNNSAKIHVVNSQNKAAGNKGDFIRFDDYDINSKVSKTHFKVDHNGYVTARDIKVTLKEIPDYVFQPDYKLPTIEDQASFIKENGHLLRMPSEKQILDENVGLGEIAMANLQISEEQMLYIIEMDKEVEELSSENKNLKERVEQLEEMVEKLLKEEK